MQLSQALNESAPTALEVEREIAGQCRTCGENTLWRGRFCSNACRRHYIEHEPPGLSSRDEAIDNRLRKEGHL